MSNNTEALIAKIKKQTESFDTVVLKEDEAKALIAALEQKEEQRANWFQMAQKLGEDMDAAEKRIAELEDAIRDHSNSTHFCEVCGKDDPCSTDDVCRVLDSTTAPEASPLAVKLSNAAQDVLAERRRQVSSEGWTPNHDDKYQDSELADAAACYAIHAHGQGFSVPAHWPWPPEWWKQTNPRRDLVKAGALILAEIERIDRAAGGTVSEGE